MEYKYDYYREVAHEVAVWVPYAPGALAPLRNRRARASISFKTAHPVSESNERASGAVITVCSKR